MLRIETGAVEIMGFNDNTDTSIRRWIEKLDNYNEGSIPRPVWRYNGAAGPERIPLSEIDR